MSLQHIRFNLIDLHRYIHRYKIPFETSTPLSKIGSIIRQYLYKNIEFKVNCKLGSNDRLTSCCVSLLPLPISLSSHKKKLKSTDFYIAFNIHRSQSTQSSTEPNAILFKYPTYTNTQSPQISRGIQLDFLAQKQLKFMVIATFTKSKNGYKNKPKKRRDSLNRIKLKYPSQNTNLLTNYRNQKYKHLPNIIDNNVAIIYSQNNLLWTVYKNKAKIIENNAWLPIVSLWKQNDTNIIYMLRGQYNKIKKKKQYKRGRSHIRTYTKSAPIPQISKHELLIKNNIGYKCKNKYKYKKKDICVGKQLKNPCKFYRIVIGEKEIICENLFDFPYLNISNELTWFDLNTKSLLIVINGGNKCILQIIKHKNSGLKIAQSTTKYYGNYNKKKDKGLSSSELLHMKLKNETIKLRLKLPKKYKYLFKNCKCLKLFHHKQSNSYILLLEKYNNKILLKLKINFFIPEIEHMSYGIINKNNNNYNIIGFDYNRSLLIMDTFYEPLYPLKTKAFGNNGAKKIGKSKPSNIYYQYNKWFSFASKKFVKKKYQIITKKFIAMSINDFVDQWKNIYDCKTDKHLDIINHNVINKSL